MLLLWGCTQTAFALGISHWRLAHFYKTHNPGRTPEDLVRLEKELKASPEAARYTAKVLDDRY